MGELPLAVVYGDLSCPFCYGLDEVLRAEGLIDRIDWRGVQHVPEAPIPWKQPTPTVRAMLESEIETVRARLPGLRVVCPPAVPNTERAILAVARAAERSQRAGAELRRRIQVALFEQSLDISGPPILDRIVVESRVVLAPATEELTKRVADWQASWSAMMPRMIPTIVRADGATRRGLGHPADAPKFVRGRGEASPR